MVGANPEDRQQQYAALDVIVPLRIYKHLHELPDLTARLASSEAAAGLVVDVVPPHGSLVTFATRAATAKILGSGGVWIVPLAGASQRELTVGPQSRLVEIQAAHAPALVVPGVKVG